jgi:hypothetical protein
MQGSVNWSFRIILFVGEIFLLATTGFELTEFIIKG